MVFGVRCSESGKLLTMLILSVAPLEVVFGSILLADCWGPDDLVAVSICCPTRALSGG